MLGWRGWNILLRGLRQQEWTHDLQQFNRQVSSRVLWRKKKSYIFIVYPYKLNSIFIIAMKDRKNKSSLAAYEEVYTKLEARGQRQNCTSWTTSAVSASKTT